MYYKKDIPEAILIALRTLCQLLRTVATASVPLLSVASFSSKMPICAASAPLRSRSCLRLSNSARFSEIRASRMGDWPCVCGPVEDEIPLLGLAVPREVERRLEVRLRGGWGRDMLIDANSRNTMVVVSFEPDGDMAQSAWW